MKVQEDKQCCSVICLTKGSDSLYFVLWSLKHQIISTNFETIIVFEGDDKTRAKIVFFCRIFKFFKLLFVILCKILLNKPLINLTGDNIMLADKEMFFKIENILREQGVLEKFEEENGEITGHMMITVTEIPPELGIDKISGSMRAFCGSFDFYDMMIGIIFDLDTMELVTQMWFTPQTDDAVEPSSEWIEFFVKTICENMSEEGFGVPMYSFVNDHSDLTIVPTKL